MSILKKILFPIFSVFLMYRSFDLVRQFILTEPSSYSSSDFFVASLMINLFVTGIFAIPGFAFPTSRMLGDTYYRLKNPEHLDRFCSLIGMKYFRVFLLFMFWGRKRNKRKYFNGTRSGLQNFVYQSRQSEFGHLLSLVAILMVQFLLAFYGYVSLFFMVLLVNILVNFYPLLLQRQHRIRIESIAPNLKP